MKKKQKLTGRAIDAMSEAERHRLVDELDSETPEQRGARAKPVGPELRERAMRWAKKVARGRPKLGKGTRVVSISVEVDLLRRADAYARKVGLKRTELFTQGLKCVVPAE